MSERRRRRKSQIRKVGGEVDDTSNSALQNHYFDGSYGYAAEI
jgi:hypothetical protein